MGKNTANVKGKFWRPNQGTSKNKAKILQQARKKGRRKNYGVNTQLP